MIADAAVHGRAVPANLIGELTDSMPLLEDGPPVASRASRMMGTPSSGAPSTTMLVQSAREEVLARLEEVGEVEPGSDGVFTGRSERDALHPDRGKFWQSVSTGDRLRQASHGAGARRLVEAIIGEAVVPFDYLMLRVATPGRATEVHYDYPFFARLHDQVKTVWIPIGDVPVDRGPVFVVEGSNRFEDVIADLRGFEVTAGSSRKAAFDRTAIELADERGTHLLTTDFGAGDVLVFGMYTAHGSFDHHDETRRVPRVLRRPLAGSPPRRRRTVHGSAPQRHDRRWLRRAERRQAAHRELARSVVRMSAGAMDDDLAPSRLASLFGLTGRHVIITGAASGLGRAISAGVLAFGARATLIDREIEALNATARDLAAPGTEIEVVHCDVTSTPDVEAAVDAATALGGPVSGLVNSAGLGRRALAADLTDEDWQEVIDVNLTGTFRMCRAGRASADCRIGPGGNRQHLVGRRAGRPQDRKRQLLGVEGRRRCPDPNSRHRMGRPWHPSERNRTDALPHTPRRAGDP